ncbi:MAG: hypothetical protein ACXW3E_12715, partial [Thermoanaerobaculia bacterium]
MCKRVLHFACVIAVASAISSPIFAATVTKINDDALAPLRGAVVMKKIRLDGVPLFGSKAAPIDLEEFQVWAPGGKVLIHDGTDNVRKIDPPAMRFFRGQVQGDPESFAYFSIELSSGKITGMVATKDDNYAIDAVKRPIHAGPRNRTEVGATGDNGYDYLLSSTNANDMNGPEGPSWQCAVENHQMTPPGLRRTQ